MKCIKDEETILINKHINKFSQVFCDVLMDGKVHIKRIRKYAPNTSNRFTIKGYQKWEVDIIFEGKLNARVSPGGPSQWVGSEIYNQKGISKVKVNRLIKKRCLNIVTRKMAFWGVSEFEFTVKKVTWI